MISYFGLTLKQQGLQGQIAVHMKATDLSYLPVQENFTKAKVQGRKMALNGQVNAKPLYLKFTANSIRDELG